MVENNPRSCSKLWLSALALLLTFPAAAGDGAAESNTEAQKQDQPVIPTDELKQSCFYAREVTNWDALNREYLLVYAPTKRRAFLLRIAPPSFDLRWVSELAFDSRNRVCGRVGDRLVVGVGSNRSFSIISVWRVPEAQVDRFQENLRRRDSKTTKPAPSAPGASIEKDITPDEN